MKKNLYQETEYQPEAPVSLPIPKISDATWQTLGETAMILIDINLDNRSALDESLSLWNSMYEMRVEPRNSPWPDAANLSIPMVPAQVEEFVARVGGSVLLPRPFSVRGNDSNSSVYSHAVEQFYNGKYTQNKWDDAFFTGIHLSARDGVTVMEIMWEQSTYERTFIADSMDEQGQPTKIKQKVKFTQYNDPKLRPVELRDLLLIPAYSVSIEAADAVCRKEYLGEADLRKLVNSGVLDAERVEFALSHVSTAQGDLSYDRQGYSTYTIGGKIDVVDVAVAPPDGVKMERGPIEIWRIHTNQYDLDNDGVPEENILWVHDRSRTLLGYTPFEYLQGRPFKSLAPFPRPNRFYGFSIPERLKDLQEELNAQHNGRLDTMDWLLNPTVIKEPSVRLREEDMGMGPGIMIDAKVGQIGFLTPPEIPQSSWTEEQSIMMYAQAIMGAPAAMGPQQQQSSGGNRSARSAQQNAAVAGLPTNIILKRVRSWMQECFEYIHGLYIQYGKDQMEAVDHSPGGAQKIELPKEILSLDYTLSIAGQGGPLDKENRRNDLLMFASFLQNNPLVQGNLPRIWALTALIAETYDLPEVTKFIGTMEEAQQQGQQQAQQQEMQQKMQFALAAMNHGKAVSTGPGGSSGPPKPM
jgi:hypothetical protein